MGRGDGERWSDQGSKRAGLRLFRTWNTLRRRHKGQWENRIMTGYWLQWRNVKVYLSLSELGSCMLASRSKKHQSCSYRVTTYGSVGARSLRWGKVDIMLTWTTYFHFQLFNLRLFGTWVLIPDPSSLKLSRVMNWPLLTDSVLFDFITYQDTFSVEFVVFGHSGLNFCVTAKLHPVCNMKPWVQFYSCGCISLPGTDPAPHLSHLSRAKPRWKFRLSTSTTALLATTRKPDRLLRQFPRV